MCLGIPGRVVRLLEGYGGQLADVDVEGCVRRVNVGLLDEPLPGPGDWVLIHMGFAVERVDAHGARRAMEGLELMGRPRTQSAPAFAAPPVAVSPPAGRPPTGGQEP